MRRLLPLLLLLVLAAPAAAAGGPGATASIVGGRDADIADWPSIAFLLAAWDDDGDGKLDSAGGCTGTVIAPQWILSVAHCAFRPDDRRVDAMLAVTGSADVNDAAAEAIAADKVVVHPGWSPATLMGDALLIHLETASARPAMPLGRGAGGPYHLDDAVADLAGWGTTDEDDTIDTDVLQEAFVSISDDFCTRVRGFDAATQACAYEKGVAGACHGDSGGPLTVLDGAGAPHLWGLTSYGPERPATFKECDLRVPVVFTRVPAYTGWIDATLAGLPWPPRADTDPGAGPGPAPGPGLPPPADTKPPVLAAVKLSAKRIAPARRGATIARRAGATLSFRLDEAAAVTVSVLRRGKVRGPVATFAAGAGTTAKRFSARVSGRRLEPGRYKLRVSAVDAAGNAASSRTLRFRVV